MMLYRQYLYYPVRSSNAYLRITLLSNHSRFIDEARQSISTGLGILSTVFITTVYTGYPHTVLLSIHYLLVLYAVWCVQKRW
jgi:hypothetical protein